MILTGDNFPSFPGILSRHDLFAKFRVEKDHFCWNLGGHVLCQVLGPEKVGRGNTEFVQIRTYILLVAIWRRHSETMSVNNRNDSSPTMTQCLFIHIFGIAPKAQPAQLEPAQPAQPVQPEPAQPEPLQ